MNYLAFDIEAANGYMLSSICSIGIVIADENFNVTHRENVWINPKTKYNLNGTRKNVGIDLHLDKKLLDASPDFSQAYTKIKRFLTAKDTLVVGHAVDSDVRMLNAACVRYRLPCIEFDFICSQLLYKLYKDEKEIKALHKIAADLGIEYREHNSEDDAWMSLMTLKYLVADSGLSVAELCDKYRIRKGSNRGFELVRAISLIGNVSKKQTTQVATEKLRKFAKTVKMDSTEFVGKNFAIARSLELSDVAKEIVRTIVKKGGVYSPKLLKCNCYVLADDPIQQDKMREKRVAELCASGSCETFTVESLLNDKTMSVESFLRQHGQSPENIDGSFVDKFQRELADGLQGVGPLAMRPTYLYSHDVPKESDEKLLIDMGGTNLRCASGRFCDGKAQISQAVATSAPGSREDATSAKEFYAEIADCAKGFLKETADVGFCFSYDVEMDNSLDGVVRSFTKGLKTRGVIGSRVGASLLKELAKKSKKRRRVVVLNDTVATLLGGTVQSRHDVYVGYVYGTGTNVAYEEMTTNIKNVVGATSDRMIVNVESGRSEVYPLGDFEKRILEKYGSEQRFEKCVSGKYLAEVVGYALAAFEKQGGFSDSARVGEFDLPQVSAFLSGEGSLLVNATSNDDKLARRIVENIVKRAARMGASMVAGAVVKSLPFASVGVVCEGSTFRKLVGYRDCFEKSLSEFLAPYGCKYEIICAGDLNLVGALAATVQLPIED